MWVWIYTNPMLYLMKYLASRPFLHAALMLNLSIFPAICGSASLPASPSPSVSPGAIVIGFVGGFVGHRNSTHNEVQLAKRLTDDHPSGLQVRMFENRRGHQAHQEILGLLDTDHDGSLSPEEKGRARIAIYGHSWGASEAITLARTLARDQIPVIITIQVDSVQKLGEDDHWIPANVTQAVNFYQSEGLLHGRSQIRAADASRTKILGNFQFGYKSKPMSVAGYPWFARMFMRPHIEIESDPTVWHQVESLILSKLLTF
jgi:hypothetical protein